MDKKQTAATYDVRVVQRHIGEGAITAADYKSFLEKLPDVASKGEPVQTSLATAEEDLDDDAHDEG